MASTINASTSAGVVTSADTSGVLQLQTAGTTALTVDTSQNVGIGTASPVALGAGRTSVTVNGSTDSILWMLSNGAASGYLQGTSSIINLVGSNNIPVAISAQGTGYTQFITGGTERMRIDSSGNVGIGTVSPAASLSVTKQATALSGTGNSYGLYMYPTSSGLSYIDSITNLTGNASLSLRTYNNGTYNEVRMDSSGNLLVGTTTGASSTSALMQLKKGGVQWDTGPNGSNGGFNVLKDGTTGVYLTSGATAWSGLSDETMKDIIEPIENASQKISTLRTVIGKYKTDEEGTRRAFLIAQDVKEVLPEAVNENENGKLGLQYTDVMPLLVAAIKEQQAIIQSLTARITVLENK